MSFKKKKVGPTDMWAPRVNHPLLPFFLLPPSLSPGLSLHLGQRRLWGRRWSTAAEVGNDGDSEEVGGSVSSPLPRPGFGSGVGQSSLGAARVSIVSVHSETSSVGTRTPRRSKAKDTGAALTMSSGKGAPVTGTGMWSKKPPHA